MGLNLLFDRFELCLLLKRFKGVSKTLEKYKLKKSKSNLDYTGDVTPTRVTSGGVHLCRLAHEQLRRSRRWPAAGDTVSDLTGPEIKSKFTSLFILSLHIANTTTRRQAKIEMYFKYGSDRVSAKGPQGLQVSSHP